MVQFVSSVKTFLWMVRAFGPFPGILASYHQDRKKEKLRKEGLIYKTVLKVYERTKAENGMCQKLF